MGSGLADDPNRQDRRVYVRGDGETPYRVIAYVLDQAKRVQANVSLVTEPSLKKQ